MKVLTIIGLAAVGGLVYYHVHRGGSFSVKSIKETARKLIGRAKEEATEIKDSVERGTEKIQKKMMHEGT